MSTPIAGQPEGIVVDGDRVVIYPALRKGVSNFNKRAVLGLLPISLLMFVIFGFLVSVMIHQRTALQALPLSATNQQQIASLDSVITFFTIIPFAIAVFYGTVYVLVRKSLTKMRDPIIVLSSEGSSVSAQMTKIGLIRWDEIADIRCYTMIYRLIGIVPKDVRAMSKRLRGGQAILLWANVACIPLYRLVGIFLAPINIAQEHLPVSADEVLYRINSYAMALPRSTVADPAAWPPPPQRHP